MKKISQNHQCLIVVKDGNGLILHQIIIKINMSSDGD